jgi:myosin heavy subunit
VVSTVPIGFLEKNRDMLNTDILTLVRSSKNKFLREIFNVESADTKLGHGTIRRAKDESQLFKVCSQCTPRWPSGPLSTRDGHRARTMFPG